MSEILRETEDNEEILVEARNNTGIITLNRPKSLNALTLKMMKTFFKTLKKFEDIMTLVLVNSGDKKAFSAGGDVFQMTESGPANPLDGLDKIFWVYKNVYLISQCKIPYVAITDGITMGGGVGLSWPGKYCIATENASFAMPETAIGFTPDIGISFFYARLEGNLGLYLALTGHRLYGKDAVKIGLATHHVESKDIPSFCDEILKENDNVDTIIQKYSQDLSNYTFSLRPNIQLINKVFSAPTVEEIFERLRLEGSEFSLQTLKRLNKMSPISLKVTKVKLLKAANLTLKECLQMDYRLGKAFLEGKSSLDFYEGVRALRDKQTPKWNPAKLEDVTDEMVNRLFLPSEQDELPF